MPPPSAVDPPTHPTVVVVLGGTDLHVAYPLPDLGPSPLVIAADSGWYRAGALGLPVHHLVGDLDSVDPADVDAAAAAGTAVHRHPADKDATDAELALDLALDLALGPLPVPGAPRPRLIVLAGRGGRLDLVLVDLLLLTGPHADPFDVFARFGDVTVQVVRPGRPAVVTPAGGRLVSLLPLHGPVRGVTADGLRWPLRDADLGVGTSRGASNELVADEAPVSITAGTLAVVQQALQTPAAADRRGCYDPSPHD